MYRKYKQLIPVLAMIGCCIVTVITCFQGYVIMGGEAYDFDFTPKHFAGFAAIVINLISFFLVRRYYKYVLAATLILGLVNLLNFSPLQNTFSIGIGGLSIRFQSTTFFIVLITLVINYSRVSSLFKMKPEHAAQFEAERQKKQVEKFKEQFSKYSPDQLSNIINDNKYAAEAKVAAQ